MEAWTLLTDAQAAASRKLLAEESSRRAHLVVSLSGAHAYGFPSPDSDVDLKAIHIEPTRRLVGLRARAPGANRLEFVDGVEVDYSSNELGEVLAGVLRGNGDYLERLLGAGALEASAELASLAPVVRGVLSRRVHRHYRGFATSQRLELARSRQVKKALYVLRTTLTGRHLLRTGEVVTDVRQLLDEAGFGDARALVEAKRRGETTTLDDASLTHWQSRLDRAFELLDEALSSSVLPEEPREVDALEAWLVELRRARW